MPLELRASSKWWYGRYEVDGKRYCVNLEVPIQGKRPDGIREITTDPLFEASRSAAKTKLDALIEEARSKRGAARLIERIYEIKTGTAVKTVKLDDMTKEWEAIPRRRENSKAYRDQSQATITRFVDFVKEQSKAVRDISRITPTLAKEFMDAEAKRGITAKTWNDTLLLLRSVFRHLLPTGATNPFQFIPTRVTETVFRKPFSPEELRDILAKAENDSLIKPIIITGVCTALRRGDCCLLKWKDVDMAKRFLNVKTSKTGQTVAIPIFPILYDELAARQNNRGEYVFPEAAAIYQKTPIHITRHVRRVLKAAGFRDPENENDEVRGAIHADREKGKGVHRASLRDFHSFRVTWVTLALTAGVPLEIVQRVTGHQTTDIVLKHYFQPGREAFRATLQNAMPRLLAQPQGKTLREEIVEAVNKLKGKITKKDTASLLALVAKVTT